MVKKYVVWSLLFVPSRNNASPSLTPCTDNKIKIDVLVAQGIFGIGKIQILSKWNTGVRANRNHCLSQKVQLLKNGLVSQFGIFAFWILDPFHQHYFIVILKYF